MDIIIQIKTFTIDNNELMKHAYHIRNVVFIEEQNVDKHDEFDGFDDKSVHYLALYNGKPAATARWRETDDGIKLERFAVVKNYRRKSLASLILKLMLEEVLPSKKTIFIHAQTNVLNFYEIHGFKKRGNAFVETGIEHYKMIFEKK